MGGHVGIIPYQEPVSLGFGALVLEGYLSPKNEATSNGRVSSYL